MRKHSTTSCSESQVLAGQNFFMSGAEEGDLAPTHPNCRCTIRDYPIQPEAVGMTDVSQLVSQGIYSGVDVTIALVSISDLLHPETYPWCMNRNFVYRGDHGWLHFGEKAEVRGAESDLEKTKQYHISIFHRPRMCFCRMQSKSQVCCI